MRARYIVPLLALVGLALGGCTLEWGDDSSGVVAAFTATPASGPAPLVVRFDASPSVGDIVEYIWSFGDTQTGSGVTVVHTYGEPGTYTVILTVLDSSGHQAQAQQNIVVTPARKPIEVEGIGITIVGTVPPWWHPEDYPENYFPEGVPLRFRLYWSDNDPGDGVTLPEEEVRWRVDRILPSLHTGYLHGMGNPWVPTEKPFVGGGCTCELGQYQVTATVRDTAGNTYSATEVFWIVPACYRCPG